MTRIIGKEIEYFIEYNKIYNELEIIRIYLKKEININLSYSVNSFVKKIKDITKESGYEIKTIDLNSLKRCFCHIISDLVKENDDSIDVKFDIMIDPTIQNLERFIKSNDLAWMVYKYKGSDTDIVATINE